MVLIVSIQSPKSPDTVFSSKKYWKRRYKRGGNSGAGSYGRLAEYKSGYINDLVESRGIESVIEIGSGDGNQASMYNIERYTGIDISPLMIERCRERFIDKEGWSFFTTLKAAQNQHDMSMSLDVIYHLVEDVVFEKYMIQLFDSAKRYVLIYASDKNDLTSDKHVRHRRFSTWVYENRPNWKLVDAPEHPFSMSSSNDPKRNSFASFKLYELEN